MSPLDERLQQQLQALSQQSLRRVRRTVEGQHGVLVRVDGRDCINFCSNDYLGLATHPAPARAAASAYERLGAGSGASALVTGFNAEHRALEEELADYLGRERALLFSSGWAANCGVLRGLLEKADTLIADELNHASLIDGGRLSGAHYRRYAHGSATACAVQLAQAQAESPHALRLLATDSVFSMDGDCAPLQDLSALCPQYAAALMVDDAHGFGVLGGGRGALFAAADGSPRAAAVVAADIYMTGFGKALGGAGAAVAGSADLIEALMHKARSWVFSTAPAPAAAAGLRASLRIVRGPEGDTRRGQLARNITQFRRQAAARGLPLLPSATAIQPLMLGAAERAVALSQALFAQGFWVAAIRPPTVPPGSSRLRITLTANHSAAQITALLDALVVALAATPAKAAV
jgi:8-amino-7-oxononanoate synthase